MPTYENCHYDPPKPPKSEAASYFFGWHFVCFLHKIEKGWHLVGQVDDEIPLQERLKAEVDLLVELNTSLVSNGDKLPIFPSTLAQAWKHYRAACVLGKHDSHTPNLHSYDISVDRESELEGSVAEERYPFESQAWTDLTDAVEQIHGNLSAPSNSRMSLGAGLATILNPHSFRGQSQSLLSAAHQPLGLEQHTHPLWEAYDGLGFMDSDKLMFRLNGSQSDREIWAQEMHSRLMDLYGAALDSPEVERQNDSVTQDQRNEANTKSDTADGVREVEIDLGDQCYVLRTSGNQPLAIPIKYLKLFSSFVEKVLTGSPGEPVDWFKLNKAVKNDSDDRVSDVADKASDGLRAAKSKLVHLLQSLGNTPDGKAWIQSMKGTGYCLNTSVNWTLSKQLVPRSVRNATTERAGTVEENTPDRDCRLPSRSITRKPRRSPDDD